MYLAAAEQVGAWLLATAQRGADGWHWPAQPGVSPEAGPGIGWGTAAPSLFFVEAFRTTGDERWLDAAQHGARWMRANLEQTVGQPAGCGLFTGAGGWVVVLDELAAASADPAMRDQAMGALEAVAAAATPGDSGVHWGELTEILWGTAGVGCLLLSHGRAYLGQRALDMAAAAGEWLISQAEPAPVGVRWSVGRGRAAVRAGAPQRYPNFAHGTAGIAFFLARLTQETGDERFLKAALRGVEWVMSTVRSTDGTCAAFHHTDGGEEQFTLGWCHGPPGLGGLFRQLELTTGCAEWRDWLHRTAHTELTSGIPERREPGFWDNVGRCCGTAGVAEFFLDLHRLETRPRDLAFATALVDDLLRHALTDGTGMRWSNHEFRLPEPDRPPETTYLQGAPGIGSTLLRLHRHLRGDAWRVRWPHAPAWDPVPG